MQDIELKVRCWFSSRSTSAYWYGTLRLRFPGSCQGCSRVGWSNAVVETVRADQRFPDRSFCCKFRPRYSYARIIIHQQHSKKSRKTYQNTRLRTDHTQTTNHKRRTNGEKFVKSGERTDKADGHIQDRARVLTGSKVSPPTHPKTNNLRCRKVYSRSSNPYE